MTDGTAANTHEIVPAGALPTGIFDGTDPSFVVFNGRLYFAGRDSSNHELIWTSDGSAATTHVVSVPGLEFPGNFATFNGSLYFSAFGPSFHENLWQSDGTAAGSRNSDGEDSLWVTDGTTAGTHEIVVPGADYGGSHGGFFPQGFTVFNGLLYFDGRADSGFTTGNQVLWVTDGTTVHQVPLGSNARRMPP